MKENEEKTVVIDAAYMVELRQLAKEVHQNAIDADKAGSLAAYAKFLADRRGESTNEEPITNKEPIINQPSISNTQPSISTNGEIDLTGLLGVGYNSIGPSSTDSGHHDV